MKEYMRVPTSGEVCACLRIRHKDLLVVFATFSDPEGTFNGGPGEIGRMDTTYGFKGCEWPLIEYRTTWKINPDKPYKRDDESHEYWLCVPIGGNDD
jgi:hypothetical protein